MLSKTLTALRSCLKLKRKKQFVNTYSPQTGTPEADKKTGLSSGKINGIDHSVLTRNSNTAIGGLRLSELTKKESFSLEQLVKSTVPEYQTA